MAHTSLSQFSRRCFLFCCRTSYASSGALKAVQLAARQQGAKLDQQRRAWAPPSLKRWIVSFVGSAPCRGVSSVNTRQFVGHLIATEVAFKAPSGVCLGQSLETNSGLPDASDLAGGGTFSHGKAQVV